MLEARSCNLLSAVLNQSTPQVLATKISSSQEAQANAQTPYTNKN